MTSTSDNEHKSIGFIGAGNMAQAIIGGLLTSGYPAELIGVSNPSPEKLRTLADQGITTSQDNAVIADRAEVIVLAVKPQKMAGACEPLVRLDYQGKWLISVAAGVTAPLLAKLLEQPDLPIVRAMPNTPAQVGMGLTGLYANSEVSAAQRQFADQLFATIGLNAWVEDEQLIDVITGLSGSGPAYYFYIMEVMQATAQKLGLDAKQARTVVAQTVAGAAELVKNSTAPIDELRRAVTSPSGTTAAGLEVLMSDATSRTLEETVTAATRRGAALADEVAQQLLR